MSLLKNFFNSSNDRKIKSSLFNSPALQPMKIEQKKFKLEDLTDNEIQVIKKYSSMLEDALYLLQVLKERNSIEITPDMIDRGIETYFTYENEVRNDLGDCYDKIPQILSAGWGQYLVDHFHMEWWVITDDWGTEIGVYYNNEEEKKEIHLFPFQLVDKAIHNRYDQYVSFMTDKIKNLIELK